MPVQTDFFEAFIVNMFSEIGFDRMSEDQQALYIPQFTAELRQKISNELVPRLSKDQVEQFVALVDNPVTTGEDWRNFWYTNIPNFDQELGNILLAFTEEVKASVNM